MTIAPLRYLTPLASLLALAACSGVKVDNMANASEAARGDLDGMAGDSAGGASGSGSIGTGTSAGTGGMGSMAGDMLNPAPTAQAFVDMAATSDAFEIAAARLAQRDGPSAEVKAFAARMIAAHTDSTARIKLAARAAEPSLTPNAALSDDQNAKLAELGKRQGADFDTAYAAAQVDAHERALALMQTYAAKGDAPTLKTAAAEIAPVVEGHLAMARKLAGK